MLPGVTCDSSATLPQVSPEDASSWPASMSMPPEEEPVPPALLVTGPAPPAEPSPCEDVPVAPHATSTTATAPTIAEGLGRRAARPPGSPNVDLGMNRRMLMGRASGGRLWELGRFTKL